MTHKYFTGLGSLALLLLAQAGHAQSSTYATRLLEYKPAPGQFINETNLGSPTAAQNVLGAPNSSVVSLGGFGGYVVVGFDQPIRNNPQNPYGVDFTVRGNAFGGWTEPGAVQVMQDTNGNGLPDDTWYELAGSEYHFQNSRQVRLTYVNPRYTVAHDVLWTTDGGQAGVLRSNRYHKQPYYPSIGLFANVNPDQETYAGQRINIRVNRSNPGYITAGSFRFGYSDNKSNNPTPTSPRNPYFADANGASADGFDIAWAVDASGKSVNLTQVDFVKIYNAAQEDAGALGETSTEVESISITTPDPAYVPQDYFLNLIGAAPFQVLRGGSQQLQGLAFKNGLPQPTTAATWSVSDPAVGSVDAAGRFSATALGKTYVYFQGNAAVRRDSVQLEVVELQGVFVSTNSPTLYVGEQSYVQAESVDQRPAPANRFIYDQYAFTVDNPALASVTDEGIVTAKAAGVVTVTATSRANPALAKSLPLTITPTPPVVALTNQLTYGFGVTRKSLLLDSLYTTTGSGQVVGRLAADGNSNPALVTATVSATNRLQLAFTPGLAGIATLTVATTAYGATQNTTLTVRVLPTQQVLKPKQVVFVNGGLFGGKKGNVQSYNPATNTTTKVAEFTDATSVQDLVTTGNFAYVSADYNILKYDLTTNKEVARRYTQDVSPTTADGQGKDGFGLNHSLTLYKDWLIATRQNSSAAPEDGYNVRIYRQSDLTLVAKIPVSAQAADVVVAGDSAFVALNGGFAGTSGQLAIIDLVNLKLQREYQLGADGTGISQLLTKKDTLLVLGEDKLLTYAIKTNTHQLHAVPLGHADFSSSPLATAIVDNTLYGKLKLGTTQEQKGFGTVNLRTYSVTQPDIIGMSTPADAGIQGLDLMGSGYDSEDQRFYLTFGSFASSNGAGRIYDRAGTKVGSFNNVTDSPERLAISYAVTNGTPYSAATIPAQSVNELETRKLTLSDFFRDDDQTTLAYTATLTGGAALPAWITLADGVLTATPPLNGPALTLAIEVTATDQYAATARQTFALAVVPVDDAPVVANPLPDLTVAVNAPDRTISLAGVFSDADSDVSKITYRVSNSTNPALVTTTVTGSSLVLSFAPNQAGTADITVEALSDGKTATNTFRLTVQQGPLSAANPAAAFTNAYPNPMRDQLTLDLPTVSAGATAQLLDLTGRVVLTQALRTKQAVLNTRNLSTGTYILVLHNNGQIVRRTLLKQ